MSYKDLSWNYLHEFDYPKLSNIGLRFSVEWYKGMDYGSNTYNFLLKYKQQLYNMKICNAVTHSNSFVNNWDKIEIEMP